METWINSDGKDHIDEGNVCSSGYSLTLAPRSHGKVGGVALLDKSTLKVTTLSTEAYHSFELLNLKVTSKLNDTNDLSVIYYPPPNRKDLLSVSPFFDEFKDYLEKKLVTDMRLCICSDLNFHLENNNDRRANSFNDIILT